MKPSAKSIDIFIPPSRTPIGKITPKKLDTIQNLILSEESAWYRIAHYLNSNHQSSIYFNSKKSNNYKDAFIDLGRKFLSEHYDTSNVRDQEVLEIYKLIDLEFILRNSLACYEVRSSASSMEQLVINTSTEDLYSLIDSALEDIFNSNTSCPLTHSLRSM